MTEMTGWTNRSGNPVDSTDPYSGLAAIYDILMQGVDYEGWAGYVETLLARHGSRSRPRHLVDLACGTGASTFPFAARGYHIDGVDLSEVMLQQARAGARERNMTIEFYRRDLRDLNLPRRFDAALLFQDGLNYLLEEDGLAAAFREAALCLNPEGLFIFDLCRPGKQAAGGGGASWAEEEHFTLLWDSSYCHEKSLWAVVAIAFVRGEDGLYRRFCERHFERDYEPAVVEKLLVEAGFSVQACYPSFALVPAQGEEPKLTFVAKKIAAA